MTTRITSKGQITIPIKIRRKLNLHVGQELVFDENAPFIKATKVINESAMRSTLGLLKEKLKAPISAILDESRGKVELP